MSEDYYTVPPLPATECVEDRYEPRRSIVTDLRVGRLGYGEIFFPGDTNISETNVIEEVKFSHKSVEVYPDQEPPLGHGLNRSAIISFHGVWPLYHSEDNEEFSTKLMLKLKNIGGHFIEYDFQSGKLTFSVPHFSKYGLSDSDEELDVATAKPKEFVPGEVKQSIKPPDPSHLAKKLKSIDDANLSLFGENEKSVRLELEMSECENLFDISEPTEIDVFSPLRQAAIVNQFSSERIAGMKASLFDDDYIESDMEITLFKDYASESLAVKSRLPADSTTTEKTIRPRSEATTKSEEPEVDFLEHHPLMTTAMQMPIEGSFYGSSKQLNKLPKFSKSVLAKHQALLGDVGCVKGHSFHVGWGSHWQLLHLGRPLGFISEKKDTFAGFSIHTVAETPKINSGFLVHKSKLESMMIDAVSETVKDNLVKNLEIQLSFNIPSTQEGVPYFEPIKGVDLLHSHAKLVEDQPGTANETKQMWDLCVALWGNLPSGNTEAKSSYNYRDDRKAALSNWLMQSTLQKLQQEIRSQTFNVDGYLPILFTHMTGRQIPEATKLAFSKRDCRLSLLLSQASSSSIVRVLMQRMLDNWHQYKVDGYIDKHRLKVYALLAGLLIWNPDQEISINCCENLDWKRSLAVHLWYHCPGTASISDAVSEFDSSFQGTSPNGKYSQPPYPSYIENDPEMLMAFFDEELDFASESKSTPYDICYHLLKLYCDRTTRLEKMLVPLTYNSSHLDYSTGWLLHQVLICLGYEHLPPYQTHQMHNNFATQLESLGLWEWSVFVLLHVSHAKHREAAIMQYLYRHVSLSTSQPYKSQEEFLVEKLKIPRKWIYSAKAVLARSVASPRDEALCLLKSDSWNHCHRVIMEQIASDCIINEEFDYLKSLLEELSIPERSTTISDWANGGEVCLDYMRICDSVNRVLRGEVSAYELEGLQPRLISLGLRLDNLRCNNARDTLCQSEMAKKTATLLRAVLTLQKAKEEGSVEDQTLTVLELSKMPMPEDYALQELRAITRAYMLEMI